MENIKYNISRRIYGHVYPSIRGKLISYEVFDAVDRKHLVLNSLTRIHTSTSKNRLFF